MPELELHDIFIGGSYLAGPGDPLQDFPHTHLRTQCSSGADRLDLGHVKNVVEMRHVDNVFFGLAHVHPTAFRIGLI